MDELTGMGQAGTVSMGNSSTGRAVGAVEDSKLNENQRCTPADASSFLLMASSNINDSVL